MKVVPETGLERKDECMKPFKPDVKIIGQLKYRLNPD